MKSIATSILARKGGKYQPDFGFPSNGMFEPNDICENKMLLNVLDSKNEFFNNGLKNLK